MDAADIDAVEQQNHEDTVIPHDLAAISVGLVDGDVYLDSITSLIQTPTLT